MLLLTLSAINAKKEINGVPKDLCEKRKQKTLFNITWIAVDGIFSEIPYDYTIFIENAQFLISLLVTTTNVGDSFGRYEIFRRSASSVVS